MNELKIDFTEVKHLSAEDSTFYCELLDIFIQGTEEGIEGIEKSIANEDWLNMAEWAHKISSPCKHFHIETLYQTLKEIENSGRNKNNLEAIPLLLEKLKLDGQIAIKLVRKELEANRT